MGTVFSVGTCRHIPNLINYMLLILYLFVSNNCCQMPLMPCASLPFKYLSASSGIQSEGLVKRGHSYATNMQFICYVLLVPTRRQPLAQWFGEQRVRWIWLNCIFIQNAPGPGVWSACCILAASTLDSLALWYFEYNVVTVSKQPPFGAHGQDLSYIWSVHAWTDFAFLQCLRVA